MKHRLLIGKKYKEEISELIELGFEIITIPECSFLDNEINNHADILSFKIRNNIIVESNITGELKRKISDYNIISCNNIKSPYPNDVKLNAAVLGNKLICNRKYVSNEIVSLANSLGYEIIHSNQGYTKCNLCILDENAVITEDIGLSYLLKNSQIDVLQIKSGYIQLSQSHHGFIGGAACMISDTQMYFSGDISSHPDYKAIKNFLNKYNINPVFNKDRFLRDFGGFILLD